MRITSVRTWMYVDTAYSKKIHRKENLLAEVAALRTYVGNILQYYYAPQKYSMYVLTDRTQKYSTRLLAGQVDLMAGSNLLLLRRQRDPQ